MAVGECGLDYYRLPKDEIEREEDKKLQKDIFISQIKLAKEFKKPLIVHIRDASYDSKNILKEYCSKKLGGVLHCFNASEELLSLKDYNFYFGIGGVVTFKHGKKLANVIPKLPIDRIIVETDAPYLTPHPYRGERNEPKMTTLVVEKLAQLLDKSYNDIEKITTSNAKRLFVKIM